MVYFLLGEEGEPETPASVTQNSLRHRLIEHCDHLSDEVLVLAVIIPGEPDSINECTLIMLYVSILSQLH